VGVRPPSLFNTPWIPITAVAAQKKGTQIRPGHPRVWRLWLGALAALIVGMVLVGGATRLTDSGLSITEWKPVIGVIPPLSQSDWDDAFAAYKTIPEYTEVKRGMSLDEFKTIYWWEWTHRLLDHDGYGDEEGGIERWLVLTDGLGLDRDYVTSLAGILPGTRFAVEAYVHFVREKSLLEAVASSLTEMFSPQIIGERVEGMLKNYEFVSADTLAYFSKRPPQAQRDANFALDYVKTHAKTPEQQQAVLKALEFKCDVLWAMLDALHHAYVAPKHISPGAFVPKPTFPALST